MNTALLEMFSQARDLKLVVDGVVFPVSTNPATEPDASDEPQQGPNIFKRSGKVWLLSFDGNFGHLLDTVGMRYIHALLKHQGRGIPASQLILMAQGEPVVSWAKGEFEPVNGKDGWSIEGAFNEEILSPSARKKLETYIEEAEGEIASLRANGATAEALAKEEDLALVKQHCNQHRFLGRPARTSNRADQNRKRVWAAIERAIQAIRKVSPALALHLGNSIRTGYVCCYRPERHLSWTL